MRSMTGFGRAQGNAGTIGFRVEISSINRKQADLKFSLPQETAAFETMLRQLLTEKISRGSVICRVAFLDGMMPEPACHIDTAFAKKLIATAETLAAETGLDQKIGLADILQIPGVIHMDSPGYEDEQMAALLRRVAGEAVDNLIAAREREGVQLEKDIRNRLNILRSTLEQIIPFTAEMPKRMYEKLLARLKEWNLDADSGDERLLRELVIFADKLDVTEEITRLQSHFLHFTALLDNKTDAVGRQLDFMVQEIFREINTLGNKAACAEVSPLIVIMKTELEKIREQIQNIE